MNRISLSFRAKLLLALVGSVGVLLGLTLAVIGRETNRQIDVTVERTGERARQFFADLERLRQEELTRLGMRLAGSNRLPGALQAALEDDDEEFLIDVANYELVYADVPDALAGFTDLDGRPVAALLNGDAVGNAAAAVPVPLVFRLLSGEDRAPSGYHRFGGQLFAVRVLALDLVFRPVGTITLGLPVDDAMARSVGDVIGADVCFVSGNRCVAATDGAKGSWLEAEMIASAGTPKRVLERDGERLALVAEELSGAAEEAGWWVIALPLSEALAPLDHIRDAAVLVGGGALVLALLLGLALSRGLTTPIRALEGATARIARGDYEARVPITSRDELGRLGDAFNEMASGLLLKERYRGLLDKVVSRDVADELLRGEITLGGESREVTILFVDIRGFTSMTQGMEPQSVIALLNEWLDRATRIVEEEEGVVDKYIGDEIMAIFGAPLARGDEALRAVRAAVRIRDVTAALNAERAARGEPQFQVGTGINTGIAVAGNMGSASRLNYTVLGRNVNLAARLCSEAAGGQIIVSRETYDAVADRVEARPLSPLRLKGLAGEIEAFEVEGMRAEVAAGWESAGSASPA